MKKLNNFTPFFILIFLVGFIGFAVHKISEKQENFVENANEDSTENSAQNLDERFIKEIIKLPEFSLPDLYDEKEEFSKRDLLKKYSLVNFFASWCTTCRAEHEVLMRLKDDNIIDIYGVAWRDIDENTKKYLAEHGNPYKKVATDSRALFTKLIGIKAVPETLIIDQKGNVVARYSGNLEESAIEEIKEFLAKR